MFALVKASRWISEYTKVFARVVDNIMGLPGDLNPSSFHLPQMTTLRPLLDRWQVVRI